MVVYEEYCNIRYRVYEGDYNPKKALDSRPIDTTLHTICVISNPCNYNRRITLANEFIDRMKAYEPLIKLYVVELVYPGQDYRVTSSDNPSHLQLKANTPLWAKENMINVCVQKMLPKEWKAMAYIDADVEFDNVDWPTHTLKALQSCDILQLFSHAIDMDANKNAMQIFQSSMYQYVNNKKRQAGLHYWHPGYAWAMNRKAYEQMGGLYDLSILGSGDDHLMRSLIGEDSWVTSVHQDATDDYKQSIKDFCEKTYGLRPGYLLGTIHHYFHGSKKNRRYRERWDILVNHKYQPSSHITKDADGLLVPTAEFPVALGEDIMGYFLERQEDS